MSLLNKRQCAVCARAVNHFGRRAQLLKVAEECRELADECEKAAGGGMITPEDLDTLKVNIAHERADVEIVLYQLDDLLLPYLKEMVFTKIASQIDRLERRMDEDV